MLGQRASGGHGKARGEGGGNVQALVHQAVGVVEVGGFLLFADGLRVDGLPTQLAALELQAGSVLREADDRGQGLRIAVQVLVRPDLGGGQAGQVILQCGLARRIIQRLVGGRQETVATGQPAAIDQHFALAAQLCQRGVGFPGRPGVHRAIGQCDLGVDRAEKAELHVFFAEPDLIQRLQRQVMADGATASGDTLALELGRAVQRSIRAHQ